MDDRTDLNHADPTSQDISARWTQKHGVKRLRELTRLVKDEEQYKAYKSTHQDDDSYMNRFINVHHAVIRTDMTELLDIVQHEDSLCFRERALRLLARIGKVEDLVKILDCIPRRILNRALLGPLEKCKRRNELDAILLALMNSPIHSGQIHNLFYRGTMEGFIKPYITDDCWSIMDAYVWRKMAARYPTETADKLIKILSDESSSSGGVKSFGAVIKNVIGELSTKYPMYCFKIYGLAPVLKSYCWDRPVSLEQAILADPKGWIDYLEGKCHCNSVVKCTSPNCDCSPNCQCSKLTEKELKTIKQRNSCNYMNNFRRIFKNLSTETFVRLCEHPDSGVKLEHFFSRSESYYRSPLYSAALELLWKQADLVKYSKPGNGVQMAKAMCNYEAVDYWRNARLEVLLSTPEEEMINYIESQRGRLFRENEENKSAFILSCLKWHSTPLILDIINEAKLAACERIQNISQLKWEVLCNIARRDWENTGREFLSMISDELDNILTIYKDGAIKEINIDSRKRQIQAWKQRKGLSETVRIEYPEYIQDYCTELTTEMIHTTLGTLAPDPYYGLTSRFSDLTHEILMKTSKILSVDVIDRLGGIFTGQSTGWYIRTSDFDFVHILFRWLHSPSMHHHNRFLSIVEQQPHLLVLMRSYMSTNKSRAFITQKQLLDQKSLQRLYSVLRNLNNQLEESHKFQCLVMLCIYLKAKKVLSQQPYLAKLVSDLEAALVQMGDSFDSNCLSSSPKACTDYLLQRRRYSNEYDFPLAVKPEWHGALEQLLAAVQTGNLRARRKDLEAIHRRFGLPFISPLHLGLFDKDSLTYLSNIILEDKIGSSDPLFTYLFSLWPSSDWLNLRNALYTWVRHDPNEWCRLQQARILIAQSDPDILLGFLEYEKSKVSRLKKPVSDQEADMIEEDAEYEIVKSVDENGMDGLDEAAMDQDSDDESEEKAYWNRYDTYISGQYNVTYWSLAQQQRLGDYMLMWMVSGLYFNSEHEMKCMIKRLHLVVDNVFERMINDPKYIKLREFGIRCYGRTKSGGDKYVDILKGNYICEEAEALLDVNKELNAYLGLRNKLFRISPMYMRELVTTYPKPKSMSVMKQHVLTLSYPGILKNGTDLVRTYREILDLRWGCGVDKMVVSALRRYLHYGEVWILLEEIVRDKDDRYQWDVKESIVKLQIPGLNCPARIYHSKILRICLDTSESAVRASCYNAMSYGHISGQTPTIRTALVNKFRDLTNGDIKSEANIESESESQTILKLFKFQNLLSNDEMNNLLKVFIDRKQFTAARIFAEHLTEDSYDVHWYSDLLSDLSTQFCSNSLPTNISSTIQQFYKNIIPPDLLAFLLVRLSSEFLTLQPTQHPSSLMTMLQSILQNDHLLPHLIALDIWQQVGKLYHTTAFFQTITPKISALGLDKTTHWSHLECCSKYDRDLWNNPIEFIRNHPDVINNLTQDQIAPFQKAFITGFRGIRLAGDDGYWW